MKFFGIYAVVILRFSETFSISIQALEKPIKEPTRIKVSEYTTDAVTSVKMDAMYNPSVDKIVTEKSNLAGTISESHGTAGFKSHILETDVANVNHKDSANASDTTGAQDETTAHRTLTNEAEIHSIALDMDEERKHRNHHNTDDKQLVKNKRNVYTTLYFKSEASMLKIDRSEHDEIRSCAIYLNSTVEPPEGEMVVYITEVGLSNMIKTCRHMDDFRRRKRELKIIFPGTKWCGASDIARGSDDLGIFEEADKCCRTHDMCPNAIGPFEKKFGLFNTALWAKSECTCDQTLYNCFKTADDPVGNLLGNLFFNVIMPPCIMKVYPQVCVKRGFFGICLKYEEDTSQPKVWVFQDNELVF